MKRFLLTILSVATALLSAKSQTHSIAWSYNNGAYLIEYSLDQYNISQKNTADGTFCKIDFAKSTYTEKKGWPEIPFASATIKVENQNKPTLVVDYASYHDTVLANPLLPSRGTIFRNQNPADIPYSIAPESLDGNFFPNEIVIAENPFMFREQQQASIRIFPFQYNASTQTLRIYDRISIRVETSATRANTPLASYDFGDILVLTPEKYDSALAPYITWKREMGYNVNVMHCDSAENVSQKIAQAYSQNPNLLYVQIVGSWNDIRSNTLGSETCYDCPTDPALGCVSGNDDIPDLAISRFACNNAEELAIQIQKSINYEKNPNNNRDWRDRFIGIGSGEGPGDDDELDYEHVRKIYNDRLSNFTYNTHSQHYAEETNVSSNVLTSSINLGASSIAYCGHGSGSYWLTGGYGSASVTASSNCDKLPFVISVACRNGAFHEGDCFAERWLNARHGGAVTTLMSSINQPWNPPMRGQDYFYDILTGGYSYSDDTTSSGLDNNEQRTRWGSLLLNTFYLMLCESAQNSDIETVKTWTSFGDASLQLRTKVPQKIETSQKTTIENSTFTTTITSNGTAVKNALVCLSQNGNYYRGFTNSRGIANIGHNLLPGKALLVVTAFNTTTIYDSIPVIPAGEPMISIAAYSPQSLNSGEQSVLVIDLANYGDTQSDNIRLSLSCDDEFIYITSDTARIAPLQAFTTTRFSDFFIATSEDTPYGHVFEIKASIEYNDTLREESFIVSATGQDCYPPEIFYVEYENDSCTITWDSLTTKQYTIFDNFDNNEAHPSFTINSEGNAGWTYIDGDDLQTGSISGYTFPNNREKMAFIVFRPEIAYSDSSNFLTQIHPHSGNQFLVSMHSTTDTTNDWIISPELHFSDDFEFSFYARGSNKPSYWETMEVYYISDSSTNRIDSCRLKGSTDPDEWTLKSYIIPDSARHVAIRNISRNQNFLCIDDITISGEKVYQIEAINLYDNGNIVDTGISPDTIILSNLAGGEHCFSVRPTCNTNLYTEAIVCIPILHEQCEAPQNAICYTTTHTDSIVWSPIPNAISYNIYESGRLIGNTDDTTFVTSTTIIPEGNYYTISSVCSQGESEQAEVRTILVGNNHIANDATKIYPNPSEGNFIVEYFGDEAQYTISDICGRNITQGKLSFGQNSLTLQGFPNGMYIISIYSDDTTYKHKIIKQ